jgi:hypothetical protein
MVIILINVLLISWAVGPKSLKYRPTIIPSIIATSTWKVRLDRSFFMLEQVYNYFEKITASPK